VNKVQFRIALTAAGMTQREWAIKHATTNAAVSQVLSGRTVSKRLSSAIERFTRQEFLKLPTLSTSLKEVTEAA